MDAALHHEARYRSAAVMARLAQARITVCGAGAVGANLVESLARQGLGRFRVIDRDRIEAANLGTQPWSRGEVGQLKARALAHRLYRDLAVEADAEARALTDANAPKLLRGSALVVDAFDNSASRRAVRDTCAALELPCLHVGLAAEGYAEVLWNGGYRVPSDAGADPCDYPMARNLVQLAVVVAAEVVVGFLAEGTRRAFTLTLRDLAIRAG